MKGVEYLTHVRNYVKETMLSYDLFTKRELIERCISLENDLLRMKEELEKKNLAIKSEIS